MNNATNALRPKQQEENLKKLTNDLGLITRIFSEDSSAFSVKIPEPNQDILDWISFFDVNASEEENKEWILNFQLLIRNQSLTLNTKTAKWELNQEVQAWLNNLLGKDWLNALTEKHNKTAEDIFIKIIQSYSGSLFQKKLMHLFTNPDTFDEELIRKTTQANAKKASAMYETTFSDLTRQQIKLSYQPNNHDNQKNILHALGNLNHATNIAIGQLNDDIDLGTKNLKQDLNKEKTNISKIIFLHKKLDMKLSNDDFDYHATSLYSCVGKYKLTIAEKIINFFKEVIKKVNPRISKTDQDHATHISEQHDRFFKCNAQAKDVEKIISNPDRIAPTISVH